MDGTPKAIPRWLPLVSRYTVIVAALLYIAVYLVLALLRLRYPFELEWMEGGSVDHVRRILSGRTLYAAPSLEFVAYMYTPLYFYLSAAVSQLIGVGFVPLRLVSLLSSLGCLVLLFLIVKRETGSSLSGILASGLFAATFRISGAWFDIARVDSLCLLLCLSAIYLLRFCLSSFAYAAAGVLIALAFLTKQSALLIALPIMLYITMTARRRSLFLHVPAFVLIGGSTWILDVLHHGWYKYYVLELPGHLPIKLRSIPGFWLKGMLAPLPVAVMFATLYFYLRFSQKRKTGDVFYLVLAASMIGASWLSKLHWGAYWNTIFPACAVLGILFGLTVHEARQLIGSEVASRRRPLEVFLYLACLIQFAALYYVPGEQVPTARDRRAGTEFIQLLSDIEGDVLVLGHGYLPYLAGKKTYAQQMSIHEVLRGGNELGREELAAEIRTAIRQQRFAAIILDAEWLQEDFERYYRLERRVFRDDRAFFPVTGLRTRPELVYVPRPVPG